jgi:hypothetical protein
MRAWIYVFDHVHYSVTDSQGRFRILSVPPGEYQLVLRQPDVSYETVREVAVAAGETTRVEVRIRQQELKRR